VFEPLNSSEIENCFFLTEIGKVIWRFRDQIKKGQGFEARTQEVLQDF